MRMTCDDANSAPNCAAKIVEENIWPFCLTMFIIICVKTKHVLCKKIEKRNIKDAIHVVVSYANMLSKNLVRLSLEER